MANPIRPEEAAPAAWAAIASVTRYTSEKRSSENRARAARARASRPSTGTEEADRGQRYDRVSAQPPGPAVAGGHLARRSEQRPSGAHQREAHANFGAAVGPIEELHLIGQGLDEGHAHPVDAFLGVDGIRDARALVGDDGAEAVLADGQRDLERAGISLVGVHDDVVGGLADRRLHVVEQLGVDGQNLGQGAEHAADQSERLRGREQSQRDDGQGVAHRADPARGVGPAVMSHTLSAIIASAPLGTRRSSSAAWYPTVVRRNREGAGRRTGTTRHLPPARQEGKRVVKSTTATQSAWPLGTTGSGR